MKLLYAWRYGSAIEWLFRARDLERRRAAGHWGFIRPGVFPSDRRWEVFSGPAPKRHGDFIT